MYQGKTDPIVPFTEPRTAGYDTVFASLLTMQVPKSQVALLIIVRWALRCFEGDSILSVCNNSLVHRQQMRLKYQVVMHGLLTLMYADGEHWVYVCLASHKVTRKCDAALDAVQLVGQ